MRSIAALVKPIDNDFVIKAMLQIRDILMKSDELETDAKNNTQKDFELFYFADIDDALIEGFPTIRTSFLYCSPTTK